MQFLKNDGLVTAEAVKRYQMSQELPATGIVAGRTIDAMERDFEGFSQFTMSLDEIE